MNARVGVLSCISLCGPDLRGQLAAEEIANGASDFLMVGFQSEVAGVVETHLGARVVALERLSTRAQKERIALAPDRQQRRLWISSLPGLASSAESSWYASGATRVSSWTP